MNMKDLVHFAPTGHGRRAASTQAALAPSYHQLLPPLRSSILRARQHLLNQRHRDGMWRGVRLGNASLPGQLVFLLASRGEERSPLARQAAEAILWQQLLAGGWSAYPGGPVDLSVSVQAYFALKLTGHAAADERLSLARQRIRELGGAGATDATTRLFLALLGQVDYDFCPIDSESLVPMAIVAARRPVRDVGLERGVRELYVNKPGDGPRNSERPRDTAGSESGWVERLLSTPVDALEFDDLVWYAVALDTIGIDSHDPSFRACEARLRKLIVVDEQEDIAQPQPGTAPTTDTAMVVHALGDSGLEPDSLVLREAVGLLRAGGWSDGARPAELAWCSQALAAGPAPQQPGDALPPRIQMAVSCLQSVNDSPCRSGTLENSRQTIAHRLVKQLLEAQRADGGWGAEGIAECGVRSAEGKTALRVSMDTSLPEVTGAVLEALAWHSLRVGHAAIDRAVDWLRGMQQADGSWDSTTGVRWIHGTSQAVRGMLAVGVPAHDPAVAAGVNWLLAYQQPSGGWGELMPAESGEPLYRPGPATATHTAWALLALVAAGEVKHEAVGHGIQFLLETQRDDGQWEERQFTARQATTGTWYRCELHAAVWPLMALSRWAVAAAAAQRDEPDQVCLRLFDD